MFKILEWPHEVLSTKCEKVNDFGPYLHQVLDEMWKTMEAVKKVDAMAMAANQVGYLKQIFIMKIGTPYGEPPTKLEFINPTWEAEKGCGWANEDEGCLSTPGMFHRVHGRHKKITVWAKDRNGEDFKMEFKNLNAVCVQHEVDHLAGIFWFDKMKPNPKRAALREWKALCSKQ